MMQRFHRYILVCALTLAGATAARADLLDDDDDPAKTPKPTAPATKGPAPSPTPAPPKSPANDKKPSKNSSLPKDEPDTEPKKTSSGSVLAPKAGAKKGPAPGQKPDAELPVEFESEGLKGLRDKGYVELEKNVVVTQGTMRVEADRAQAFYDPISKELVKVTAEGNVKMFKTDEATGEKVKAYGDSVLFLNKDRRAILEGNARLWRGADLLRGKKITYELDTGWIYADRVAGELHPQEKP